MSTTSKKRLLIEARRDAQEFHKLFAGTFQQWEIAGSVRREVAKVSDIEHVAIPKMDDVLTAGNLFAAPTNLIWNRLDELVAEGKLSKHVYSNGFRWGDKYRGVDFRGFCHEIWLADKDNWGPQLTIRTGPASFSRKLVSLLHKQQRRNKDGYVWNCKQCEPGPNPGERIYEGQPCDGSCDETGLHLIDRLSVPDEEMYFQLCGAEYLHPSKRKTEE